MKSFLPALTMALALAGYPALEAKSAEAGSPPAAETMRDLTSMQFSALMSPGWNLGNALEAIDSKHPYVWGSTVFQETAWGNPPATRQLFDAVKAAGFRSVRIPVSWKVYADAQDNISPQWMARVAQVVDDARAAGLIVMINLHWDGGWMQPTYAAQNMAQARTRKFWHQIATRFRDYGDTLLFAGTNEVMVDGDYGAPTSEYCAVQNSYNQTFIDAVRATGGNNARRHLVVQGFNTNINYTLKCNATLPHDSTAQRMMMEVHDYDPYDFALDEKSGVWRWGSAANPSGWANEAYTDGQFEKLRKAFIAQGIPVLLGEYSAIQRSEFDPSGSQRKYWDSYMTRAAHSRGIVPMYWDNGYTTNHQSGLFDRGRAVPVYGDIIEALVSASR